ncbi:MULTISPECIES: NAD(P)/FAD-dependent oxidoreductase [unclassified Pseudomonas]|uniref:FAD-dependent oxidoreductase n=1 Tax=unclassified Pseudomonas TaxID=196821 RepID=UPI00088794D9|nr:MULTISPECIES: FAD-dependent oxidoreductase [unclassified Pseudomonas]SCZ06106.1 FAD binding domain-containing protein [Pseudomonas sp. NFACC37-1]SFO81985.1 FAD binding domain-containing protein [Pseudomonas sp. NFACC24-1]
MTAGKRIIIIGAGPAGLVTAFGLAQRGAQVTVIDREPQVVDSPRAMVYLPSTVKALDRIGLLEAAKKLGPESYDYQCYFAQSGNVGRMDHRLVEDLTPYHYVLHFGQDVLAKMILRRLVTFPGSQVLWNTTLDSIEQHDDCVVANISDSSGKHQLEADWLIGADGARSTVRKLIGASFDGFTWPDTFMATNIFFDFSKHGYAASNMVSDPVNWAVIARVNNDNLWRVAYGEDSSSSDEERMARVDQRLRHWLPKGAEYRLERANSYRVHQRAASTFRAGRVLLAGDAAHATNPIGGMGFTSGIQDAITLIDTFEKLFKGQAGDDVLDWYAYERRRIFLEVANPTAIEFKRRTQEADPEKRAEDERNFLGMTGNHEILRGALMSVFGLESRPYQSDWREAVIKQDQERSEAEKQKALVGGTTSTLSHTSEIE